MSAAWLSLYSNILLIIWLLIFKLDIVVKLLLNITLLFNKTLELIVLLPYIVQLSCIYKFDNILVLLFNIV